MYLEVVVVLSALTVIEVYPDLKPQIRSRLPFRTFISIGAPHNDLHIWTLETLYNDIILATRL
jgi:hypothetical protein